MEHPDTADTGRTSYTTAVDMGSTATHIDSDCQRKHDEQSGCNPCCQFPNWRHLKCYRTCQFNPGQQSCKRRYHEGWEQTVVGHDTLKFIRVPQLGNSCCCQYQPQEQRGQYSNRSVINYPVHDCLTLFWQVNQDRRSAKLIDLTQLFTRNSIEGVERLLFR